MSNSEIIKSLINLDRCYVCDLKQGSKDWLLMRKGRITMSSLASFLIFAKTEDEKITAARIICGLEKKIFTEEQQQNMAIGKEYEDLVRQEYSNSVGMKIYETGICIFKENSAFGGSPDGVLENGDLIEIKITNKEIPTHIMSDYSEIPIWYYWQMQGCMFVMDAPRCHYVSYSRLDKKTYTRIIPYNNDRWINEVYIPACYFHRNYVMPLLKTNNLPDPYETYKLCCKI